MPVGKIPFGILDSRYVNVAGDTMTGALTVTGLTVGALSGYVKATAGLFSAGAIADGDLPATIKGLTLSPQAIGFTIAGGTTSKTLTVALDASVSGTNTGDNAANSSTMYIGTTAHALNRGSAAEGLAGITSLTPATDFTLVQNSVNALTSVESGAIVNTLVLKAGNIGIGTAMPANLVNISSATLNATSITNANMYVLLSRDATDSSCRIGLGYLTSNNATVPGVALTASRSGTYGRSNFEIYTKDTADAGTPPALRMIILSTGLVGIGTDAPSSLLEVSSTTASPILTITNKTDTNTYDPQIQFRSGATPAVRWAMGFDDSDSDKFRISPLLSDTYPILELGTTGKSKIQMLDNDTEAFMFREATNVYLTFVTTNDGEKITIGKNLETGLIVVDDNSGAVNFIDMAVTATAPITTEESLSIAIDGNALFKVYAQSNGAGGIQNTDVKVLTNATLGNASTDIINMTGRMVVRTLASDPKDVTPGNRPAGTVGEIGYYSGKWYGCVSAAVPTWELFTSV